MSIKLVFEELMAADDISREDGGRAMVFSIDNQIDPPDRDSTAGPFVRFQSWDDAKEHSEFRKFIGKRVRITIEVV